MSSHPNHDGSSNDSAVRDDVDVLVVFVSLLVLLVLVNLVLLFDPAGVNEVNGRMLDVSHVEEFNNLGMNTNSQIAVHQEPQNE